MKIKYLILAACILFAASYLFSQSTTAIYNPTQIISEKIGPEFSKGTVFDILYNDRPVTFVGQTHNLPVYQELKKYLIQEALAGRLVLILEGLPRDSSWESNFRQSKGGKGNEPIYGMEDAAALLVEAGFICRNIMLGVIDNYGINCPDHLVNHSSFEPLGILVWNELTLKTADESTKRLIQELDPFIKQIQYAPTYRSKLDAFEAIQKKIPNIPSYSNSYAWFDLYTLYTTTALEHSHSMPPTLVNLTMQLLNSEPTISAVQEWLDLDSAYREQCFAETILWVMRHSDTALPTVILVGKGHLIGLFKTLANIQGSRGSEK